MERFPGSLGAGGWLLGSRGWGVWVGDGAGLLGRWRI